MVLFKTVFDPVIGSVALDAKQVALIARPCALAVVVVFEAFSSCEAICASYREEDFGLLRVELL